MPYGGTQPWCPWLMPLSFMACIVVFVYTMYVNNCPEKTGARNCVFYNELGRFSFQPRSENFFFGPSVKTLKEIGGLNRNLVVDKGQNYRLFSCMWLHGNVIHLIVNVLAILLMGVRLEEDYGFLKIGLLYVLSGLGANILSCLRQAATEETISVGASGALFGLLGSSLSEIITNWNLYANKCAALTTLLIVIALNLTIGFIPGVDGTAHIGGLLAGFFLGFLLLLRPQYGYFGAYYYIVPGHDLKRKKPKYQLHQQLFWVLSFVILIIGYMVGLAKLYKGERVVLPIPSFDTKQMPNLGAAQSYNVTEKYNNTLSHIPN
ncbi:Rhomboid-like protein [Melia azedarach]|uniref:Rhomboid-like protein n=1 Tax=Melia azedarach TaxID=155640 RepID=A0ACC1Y3X4_MELAZ|nr:Rhomboid-like protein [Melia azedarach]